MKQKHLKRRIGTVIVAWIMLLSGSLPVSAAMLEITGTFGDQECREMADCYGTVK